MSKISRIFSILRMYRYIIVIGLAVLFIGFVGENSYLAHIQHQSTIKELKREIAKNKAQYDKDTEQLNKMDSSMEAMRKVARERYFMKAANEDIFIVEE